MPSVQGYTALDLKVFGGLCTLLDATNLPIFMSPDCKNVEFLPGLVRTRPGLTNQFSTLTGLPSVNYLKTYINQLIQARLLVLDSNGILYKENPQGTLSQFGTIETLGAYGNSTSLFAREYMAFGDGIFGNALPRQYDDTNLDRVSQVGPGAGPTATDFLPPAVAILNSGLGAAKTIATVTRSGSVTYSYSSYVIVGGVIYPYTATTTYFTSVDVATTGAHGFTTGMGVIIAGVTDTSFNTGGTSSPVTVIDATHFSYLQYSSTGASSTGGTATPLNASVSRNQNVLTITTGSAHGFQVGWSVSIQNVPEQGTGGATTALRSNSLVTLTTATAHNLPVGSLISVETMTDATFDGLYVVTSVPSSTTLTYIQDLADSSATGGTVSSIVSGTYRIQSVPTSTTFTVANIGQDFQASPGGATATVVGNVVAGYHQVSVSFITRSGYITKPSPPIRFTASGGKLIALTNIPNGPSNVVGRRIMFTPLLDPRATLGSFYSILPTMDILDNSTTSAIYDFSDTNLLQGELQDGLFALEELQEAAGVMEYNSRLVWWGLRNNLLNFDNLTFDGGQVISGGFPGYPLGWTVDPTNGAGGGVDTNPSRTIFGNSYFITGNGASATRGMITQNAYADSLGNLRLEANTSYSVRFWLSRDANMLSGKVIVDVFVPSTSTILGSVSVQQSSIGSTSFSLFSGQILAPQASIPTDTVLRVYASGTPTNAWNYYVEQIELFETGNPYFTSDVRFSQSELPENYSGDGFASVAPENGQSVRCVFRLRNYIYYAKESSLYVSADDGQNEPSAWSVNEVSSKIGTPSPRGVGLGDEWAVIASRSGLYLFDGSALSDESKLSTEIQPTWDTINWNAGQTIIVKVDTVRKRIYVSVPTGTATKPNVTLTMDYVEGFGSALSSGVGRKWTIWDIPANSMDFVLRPNSGSQPLFIGNNTGTGKIYSLDDGADNDDGVAINSYWQSGFFQQATRLNFGYIVANIIGSGTCNLLLRSGNQLFLKQIRGWTLNPNSFSNLERQIQINSQRMAVRFGTNGLTDNFSLQGAALFVQPSSWTSFRGTNNSA